MNGSEDTLQERLEQLETGVPLEACLADLSEDEADLLRLVSSLRQAPHPQRDAGIAAAQRAQVLRQMGAQRDAKPRAPLGDVLAGIRPLWNWLRPRKAFAGAVAVLAVCVLIALAAAGVFRPSSHDEDVVQVALPEPTAEQTLAEKALPEPTTEQMLAQPTMAPTFEVMIPVLSLPRVRDPVRALLNGPQGLVEVQSSDGTWASARAGNLIAAGQSVRTGVLSSVQLIFNDGSTANLGPNTEVYVDELDARPSDGPRIVVLTQWLGETHHDVASVSGANSRYEVRTPSATGVAKGTAFQVQVTPDRLTRFSVDEGAVAVSGQNVTVDVVAGQSTTVNADQPPDEPDFRISGEGEVTAKGAIWTIAGQDFETHDGTIIEGNPQVGDWVYVEGRLTADGRRIADRIRLVRRSPENRFTIRGTVDEMGASEWIVAGQPIRIDEETVIDEGIELNDPVQVEGVILPNGVLLAERIRLVDETVGLPFSFTGVVQEIFGDTWEISGVVITIDEETEIDEDLSVGDIVHVRGWILDGGVWLASAIRDAAGPDGAFEFVGAVESIKPWIVAGISLETRRWTEIDAGIQVGDQVRVRGRILEDGTWLAFEIKRLEADDRLGLVFVGTVDSTDPWVVSGIPLSVTIETVIEGEIEEGDLVRVTVEVLRSGEWLATRIELIDLDDGGLGCVTITAVVVAVGPDWVEVYNWPVIDLDGVVVEGELEVGSVVLMLVCVDDEGTITVQGIVVIYQPEPVMPPGPEPPPEPPPSDEDEKVTVCHKANTKNRHSITIARPALQAHLNHGDTMGPCE